MRLLHWRVKNILLGTADRLSYLGKCLKTYPFYYGKKTKIFQT